MDWRDYAVEDADRCLDILHTSRTGLQESEAAKRLKEYGHNSLPDGSHFVWRILRRRVQSLLFWILLIVAVITFFFQSYTEALLILLFLAINASLEIYQEFHSEKAARLLKHYLVPEAQVWREGQLRAIKTSLLVQGDILELKAGDSIPADVRFLQVNGAQVDESLITGESVSVPKTAALGHKSVSNLFEGENCGFAGTNLVAGQALAVVVATGSNTALGDVAHLASITEKETTFEKNIREFSSFLVKLLLAALALVFFLYFLVHGQSASVVHVVVFALVLAITVVPEALPAITTVALTRGSLLLARKKVIVKRLSAIEDLGSVQILCTDKTGTLTENKLQVVQIYGTHKDAVLDGALLASQVVADKKENLHDAFDKALYQHIEARAHKLVTENKRVQEFPFTPEVRMNGVVVENQKEQTLIVRGAPEEILARVAHLDAYTRNQLAKWIQEAGFRGERVLAVATKKEYRETHGLQSANNLTFEGLVSFLDPLKESAKDTIRQAKALGVNTKIFSGDSKEVVGAVSYAVGLISTPEEVITGADFENLSLSAQIHALEKGAAFARFSPRQKYAALQLLQKSHTVGFLGEGINDAPSLKIAHVALVVDGASDIAREASDVLLLEKDLAVIIEGIKEGRRVFANILKYLKITLAANFGNFYSVALATLMLPFLPLLPLQILLLNLLSDLPMLAIATDQVDHEKLERPNAHNMGSIIVTATLFGAVSTFFDLTIFRIFLDEDPSVLQTAWFTFSLLSEVVLIYSLRTRRWFFNGTRSSFWLTWLSMVVVLVGIVIPYTWIGERLSFEPLPAATLLFLGGLLLLYFVTTEVLKHWYYQHAPLTSKRRIE